MGYEKLKVGGGGATKNDLGWGPGEGGGGGGEFFWDSFFVYFLIL